MDKFLQIRELKDMVCQELANDSRSLLSVVLTCRSFVEPGLDRLWNDIELVRPLVCCLPEGVYQKEAPDLIMARRYVVSPNPNLGITPADLERFQTHYAHRIRAVQVRAGGRRSKATLSSKFMDALVTATEGRFGALSPNLTTFRWCNDDYPPSPKQILPYLTLLVGTSVKFIDLPVATDPDGLISLTALRLPLLESVSLKHANLESIDKFFTSATGTNLRSMVITTISDSMIPFIAALPKLETLQFKSLKDITSHHAQHVSRDPKAFRPLRLLDVVADELETAMNLLRHLPPTTALGDLSCSVPTLSDPSASQAIIGVIASHVDPAALVSLRVIDCDSMELDHFSTVGIHDGFGAVVIDASPLFKFANLKDVFLHFHGRVRVTPSDVKLITTSWKQVENLDLSGTWPIDRVPSIDHTHILQFAEGCPKLRNLSIPFNGTGIQGDETSSRGPFPNIETIGVCGSPVEYPSCLPAFFVRNNFPNASLSRSYPEGFLVSSEPSWVRWKDVEGALNPEGPQVAMEDTF